MCWAAYSTRSASFSFVKNVDPGEIGSGQRNFEPGGDVRNQVIAGRAHPLGATSPGKFLAVLSRSLSRRVSIYESRESIRRRSSQSRSTRIRKISEFR